MTLEPMFTSVAKKYDLLNRMLTVRLDEVWREYCAEECLSNGVIVDLCCGTGDLALHILKHASPETHVIGLDFSRAMLARAVEKKRVKALKRLSFIVADAAHLPFKNECVESIGVSFSFRNLVFNNPQAKMCLREAVRTLRLKGKFVCVETSQPKHRSLRVLYHLYLMRIVPLVGWLVSGRRNAYRYLGASATYFPSAEEIRDMLLSLGFREVSFKRLSLGVAALHVGIR